MITVHGGHSTAARGRIERSDVLAVLEDAGVAAFKRPERLVIVDRLPVTNIGKVDKKALRADIAERMAGEAA